MASYPSGLLENSRGHGFHEERIDEHAGRKDQRSPPYFVESRARKASDWNHCAPSDEGMKSVTSSLAKIMCKNFQPIKNH